MGLLLQEDYDRLGQIELEFEEDDSKQFLVFHNYELPPGLYSHDSCSVLVVIPTTYNDEGIDCVWVSPHLRRQDSKPIPQVSNPGAGENHHFKGTEYCRWSRHWNRPSNAWRPSISNIDTILRRLRWVFSHPDADR